MTPLIIELPRVQLVLDPPTAHLVVELAVDEITPQGALKNIEEMEIPRSAYRVTTLQANDPWIGVDP